MINFIIIDPQTHIVEIMIRVSLNAIVTLVEINLSEIQIIQISDLFE